jgi:Holliday junction resolvase RusA-like endonuclease
MKPTSFVLQVFGVPIAQPRPRFTTRTGFPLVYTPKNSPINHWKKLIILQAKQFKPIDCGALEAEFLFVFPRPKYHFRKGVLIATAPKYHTSKPDLDNLIKAALDALQNSGLISDDCKVAKIISKKVYQENQTKPQMIVSVSKLNQDQELIS